MSNELNNIICRNSDGVYEGIAIGGDRYPGSRFVDHLLRYNDNPSVHMLVLLGEVGGVDEYEICDYLKSGRITKPIIAWCIGTCASIFPFEVQFGHAGALARGDAETAIAKVNFGVDERQIYYSTDMLLLLICFQSNGRHRIQILLLNIPLYFVKFICYLPNFASNLLISSLLILSTAFFFQCVC